MSKLPPAKKDLPSTVIRLGLVSFFADISSEMLYPITPIFLTAVLGASMTSVGLIEGIAEGIASLLKTYSGSWSDRLGNRKTFIWVGYLLSALAKPLTGISSSWVGVLVARGIDRTGKGLRTAPRDALIADTVSEKNRGFAFGWHRFMDTMGATLGPLIAIAYLSIHSGNLRSIYYWALIPGILSVGIALSVSEHQKPIIAPQREKWLWKWQDLSPAFKTYLLGWGIFSIANSSDVFLLMQAKQHGSALTTVILMYCFYNLTYALASPYLGHLSDQIGRKKCLIFGLLIFATVYLGFSVSSHQWQFWALFGIYGLYNAATDGVGKAMAIDLIAPDKKATAIGILGTITGISTLGASVIAGLIWDHVSVQAPFLYGALGSCLACMILSQIKSDSENTLITSPNTLLYHNH